MQIWQCKILPISSHLPWIYFFKSLTFVGFLMLDLSSHCPRQLQARNVNPVLKGNQFKGYFPETTQESATSIWARKQEMILKQRNLINEVHVGSIARIMSLIGVLLSIRLGWAAFHGWMEPEWKFPSCDCSASIKKELEWFVFADGSILSKARFPRRRITAVGHQMSHAKVNGQSKWWKGREKKHWWASIVVLSGCSAEPDHDLLFHPHISNLHSFFKLARSSSIQLKSLQSASVSLQLRTPIHPQPGRFQLTSEDPEQEQDLSYNQISTAYQQGLSL